MRHRPHRSTIALVLTGLLLSTTPLAHAIVSGCAESAPPDALPSPVQATLDAAMPGLMRAAAVPGAALALIEDGDPRFAAGYRDSQSDASAPPVTARTLFQAASVSKPVAAWTFLRVVEDGRLDLDTPIVDALGDWRFPPSPWDPSGVTLRRILSHTAGLSVSGYGGFTPGTPPQSLLESLHGASDAGGQALALSAAPGTGFSYSGGGYTLAELLLERVTGVGFAEVAHARVLQPLGMSDSRYAATPAPSPPLARTYDDRGHPAPAHGFTALAAAGLQTNAEDLARFVAALLPGPCGQAPGRGLLAPAFVELMLTPQPHSSNDMILPRSRYGLGIALARLPSGRTLAFHPGDNLPNWHNLIALIPELRAGLVLLTNARGGDGMQTSVLCTWLRALGEDAPAESCAAPAVPRPE